MSEPTRAREISGRRVWWWAFVVFTALGAIWSATTPVGGGPDERAHIVKAVAVAHGQLTTDVRWVAGGGGVEFPTTDVRVATAYARLPPFGPCWAFRLDIPPSCADPVGTDTSLRSTWTYVGAYPPGYYLLVGWPSRFLDPETAIYAMRLLTTLLGAALLASGIVSASSGGRRAGRAAGCALAITPMAVFLSGTVNPNSVEIAAAFALWATLLEVLTNPAGASRRVVARLAVAGVALTIMRPLGPLFLVSILPCALLALLHRTTLERLVARRSVRWAAGIVGATAVASSALMIVNRSLDSVIRFPLSGDPGRTEAARRTLDATGAHLEGAIGRFGWEGFGAITPTTAVIDGWLLGVVALAGLALVVGTWRERVALAGAVVGVLALPVAALAASTSDHEVGWQGRYVLPIAVGVPLLAGWMIDRAHRPSARLERLVSHGIALAVPVALVVAHARLLTRLTVGLPSPLLAFTRRSAWDGPLTPTILFGVGVLAAAGYAVLLGTLVGGATLPWWPGGRVRSTDRSPEP